jgi:hypothetical protein
MKHIKEFETFEETLANLERDKIPEVFYRARVQVTDKQERIPYVEISAVKHGNYADDFTVYMFHELLAAPVSFAKMEHESDDAFSRRVNEFTVEWAKILDNKYVRALQGLKGAKIIHGATYVQ